MNFQRSRSGGDDPARRDRKKGKQKRRGGIESPEDLSPTKKNKRHNRYLHPTKYQMNIRIDIKWLFINLYSNLDFETYLIEKSPDTMREATIPITMIGA